MNSKLIIMFMIVIGMALIVSGRVYRSDIESDDYDSNEDDFDLQDVKRAMSPRGFGCHGPFNKDEYKCNKHCKSNGFKGGYCNALTGWLRCDCY